MNDQQLQSAARFRAIRYDDDRGFVSDFDSVPIPRMLIQPYLDAGVIQNLGDGRWGFPPHVALDYDLGLPLTGTEFYGVSDAS